MENNSAKSPRKTLGDRSVQGFNISITKNSYPRGNSFKYRFISVEKLLSDSVQILSLHDKAKKAFNKDGKAIVSEEDVEEGMNLFISCGEPFGSGLASPTKRRSLPNFDDVDFSSGLYNTTNTARAPSPSDVKPSPKKEGASRKEIEKGAFHRMIALSQRSVQQTVIESSVSSFASLDVTSRKSLENYSNLLQLMKDAQYHHFQNHLTIQRICPSNKNSDIDIAVDEWCISRLNELTTKDIKFVISGPPKSGKSSLMYNLSLILLRKIQESQEIDEFMYVPINFAQIDLDLGDIDHMYKQFITIFLNAASYSNFAVSPFVPSLITWFLSLISSPVIPAFPQIPPVNGVDSSGIQEIGKKIFSSYRTNKNLSQFIENLVSFPHSIATSISRKNIIMIIDHFEYCDIQILDPELFPQSRKPVSLANIFSKFLGTVQFIVSMKSEQMFFQCFKCESLSIDTDNILDSYKEYRELVDISIPISLTINDCLKAPGYISSFVKLADLVQENAQLPQTNKFSSISSSALASKTRIIKTELSLFCKYLVEAGNEKISIDLLNALNDSDTVSLKLIDHSPKETEASIYKSNKSSSTQKPTIEEPSPPITLPKEEIIEEEPQIVIAEEEDQIENIVEEPPLLDEEEEQ